MGTLVLGLFALASPVLAHSDLKESIPVDGQTMRRAFDHIEIVFWSPMSEPAIEVVGPHGLAIEGHTTQVDDVTIRFDMDPPTDEGEYAVRYEVRSADGDLTDGTIAFAFAPDSAGQSRVLSGVLVAAVALALSWWVVDRVRTSGPGSLQDRTG